MMSRKLRLATRRRARMVDDAEADRINERNAFFESLPPEAKGRFLDALQGAVDRGLDEEIAWREAVIAAQTAYSTETNL